MRRLVERDVSAGDLEFVSARTEDRAGSPLIAVVDDDEDVRAALEGLLGSLGYRAALFASADSFLRAQRLDEVTCIISDVQMPGKSGLKLAEEIQAQATPIILITAFPSPEVEQRAKAAGVSRLLIKPFESGELIDQLSKLAVHPGTAEPVNL
ncbi:response regulator [Sphingomonas sp. S2-65]|uniref:response regulator n=1 Tax=Sphingomonas sp. S2-65 TaxID=2903960 RepID=UPI001F32F526|nr:response regulator [Sphingomonas sp. S2-65]UYY58051.1 response regulator [Sphingomonas sp. S2-65]